MALFGVQFSDILSQLFSSVLDFNCTRRRQVPVSDLNFKDIGAVKLIPF